MGSMPRQYPSPVMIVEGVLWVEPHVTKLLFESEFILEALEGER